MVDCNKILKEIFSKSVESVQPQNLIKNSVQVNQGHIEINSERFQINKPCYIVGFGKAVLGMSVELENLLQKNLKEGVVSVPKGIFETFKNRTDILPKWGSKIRYIEGAKNNLPDLESENAAKEIKYLVEKLKEDDLLIVLISGGGSALMPLTKPPINLEEKLNLIKKLSTSGADIKELNCLRKQMSILKGGGLAKIAFPCRIVTLILSDIVGDPIDYIASGPTVPNFDSKTKAIEILKKYGLYDDVSSSIKKVLNEKNSENEPKIFDGSYEHVKNFIIGNNEKAVETAFQSARSLNFQSVQLSTEIEGDVTVLSEIYSDLALKIAIASATVENHFDRMGLEEFLHENAEILKLNMDSVRQLLNFDFRLPICLILAGEPTIKVTGNGKGGRNQQLALDFSLKIHEKIAKLKQKNCKTHCSDVYLLCSGTDGIDGPTDAAGAIGTNKIVLDCLNSQSCTENPESYLKNNDSYTFFNFYKNGRNLIKIGHTGTNVMDLHIMLIIPK